MKQAATIFWFRRDLRLDDNAGLYHALKSSSPVICLFIFDNNILDKLEDKDDARVTFIHNEIKALHESLSKLNSALIVKHATPALAWKETLNCFL